MKYIIYENSEWVATFKNEYDCDICLLTLQEESPDATFVKAIGK